jgi:hypothetical protein
LGQVENAPDLFYWNQHCLENYLIHPASLARICVEEDPSRLTDQFVADELNDVDQYVERLFVRYTAVTRLFIVARRFRVSIETTKMDVEDLLEGADAEYPLPTEDWAGEYQQRLQAATHGDNEWLADNDALDVQRDGAFQPNEGHELLNSDIRAHLNGKHLIECLIRFISRRLGVEIQSLGVIRLYVRMISAVPLAPFSTTQGALAARYSALLGEPAAQ